jgi:hypothetical protein
MVGKMRKAVLVASIALVALGIGSSATYLLTGQHGSPPDGKIAVSFGKPTKMARMKYTVMYDKKPFPDAVLLYYDNGVYAIVSQGENHYGTYVLDGSFDKPNYTVHFISLPSADWNGKSVYHQLQFDTKTGTFAQQLTNPDDSNVPPQTGTFTLKDNPITDPTQLTWQTAQSLGK